MQKQCQEELCQEEQLESCQEEQLESWLNRFGLLEELSPTCNEINRLCIYENFIEKTLENYDYIGNGNCFKSVMKDVNEVHNFDFGIFTITLIQTNHMISENIDKFREDFRIWKLFRICDQDDNKCYVIVTTLKPYWITTSLNNFIDGTKKLCLFDGEKTGYFRWVRLKNVTWNQNCV